MAFRTLAVGTVCRVRQPRRRPLGVRTANETLPRRFAAQARASAISGAQPDGSAAQRSCAGAWAGAAEAPTTAAASRIVRRRTLAEMLSRGILARLIGQSMSVETLPRTVLAEMPAV